MSDTLIYAMSTSGKFKLEQFNDLFRHVSLPASSESEEQIDVNKRQQAVRILDSLGYCEFDFNSRTVYMCKPALVLLPDFGLPKALLVGARTPRLVGDIKKAVRDRLNKTVLEHVTHSGNNAAIPSAICIQATDKTIIHEVAEQAGIACDVTSPAAWKLAVMSAVLDEIKNAMIFDERTKPGWNKRTFIKKRLMFSSISVDETGQRLTEYRHPVTKQLHHWIWNDSSVAEISRDWGRYIVLADAGCNILMYDEQQFELAVPVTVPLPCLLARAAALCSGIPPSPAISCREKIGGIPPDHPYQVYTGVPPKIAGMIASKLHQKLLNTSFAVDKKGVLHA
ncbi:MAG: hypothetical protein ISS41_09105 [Candidatus Aminicenantes bacterium]|nr:hypothetical protein [Candidatus Aminicenantes bacterium]